MYEWLKAEDGPAVSRATVYRTLEVLEKGGFIEAVETGNVHAIWHQFYNSPYYFVAVQQLAKWFHPELFEDLDPEATLEELHDRFLPIDYQPGYWITLHDE